MGFLFEVGMGRLHPEDLFGILEARKRSAAPAMAPAHGLYLVDVYYHENDFAVEEDQVEETSVIDFGTPP